MYTGMLHMHNLLRWVILVLLVIAVIRHFSGAASKRSISPADNKIDLFLLISAHITLVVGLYQWIVGPWGIRLLQQIGFGEVMKNSAYRFFAVEHFMAMITAVVLITVGRGAVKRGTDWRVHKKAAWLFLIALVLVLAAVPWPFRGEIARPLFPGM